MPPGEVRDTTTPLTMLCTVQMLVMGEALAPPSRAQLQAWLLGNLTGDKRLRWRVGEKTGTAEGTANDVGVVRPAPGQGAPAVVACYLAECPVAPAQRDVAIAQRDVAIAQVGRLATAWLRAS